MRYTQKTHDNINFSTRETKMSINKMASTTGMFPLASNPAQHQPFKNSVGKNANDYKLKVTIANISIYNFRTLTLVILNVVHIYIFFREIIQIVDEKHTTSKIILLVYWIILVSCFWWRLCSECTEIF